MLLIARKTHFENREVLNEVKGVSKFNLILRWTTRNVVEITTAFLNSSTKKNILSDVDVVLVRILVVIQAHLRDKGSFFIHNWITNIRTLGTVVNVLAFRQTQ